MRRRVASLAAAALLAAACASSPAPPRQARTPAPPAAPVAPTVSYDWHPLILVPFGTLLKQSPIPLHEVLLFRDPAQDDGNEGKDCYAPDGAPPPPFAGRRVDAYMLCFEHDRLNRIEATLHLPAGGAGETFAAMCADWRKTTASTAPPANDDCEGRDGATGFSAHLGADASQPEVTLAIGLYSVIEP